MKKKNFVAIAFLLLSCGILRSQELAPDGGGEFRADEQAECLSEEKRAEIQQMLAENVRRLKSQGLLADEAQNRMIVAFGWPLQKAPGLEFNSYYGVNNFVDHDPGAGLLDYNCDARTYDGHTGIDIDTWPFPWYLYDNDAVQVIAGEAGTIIGTVDGNDDDHCSCLGNWNAIFIQHADGSRAWYGHMKKNSLTNKGIGDAVAKGEYLGVVASSGCSTQPHLHFEVFDNLNNLVDPYSGPCNGLNAASWWSVQPANREPTLNAIMTHDDVPVHGCPGINEDPNISNIFVSGQLVRVAAYYHDQLIGDVTTHRIRRPDNSVYNTWTGTSNNTYNKSWWFWNWFLPAGGPFGTWKFEAEYRGQTLVHEFQYLDALPPLQVNPIVYLQGAYAPGLGLMRDDLRTNAVLPLAEPYAALGYTHVGGGGESMEQAVLDVSGAGAIVDWVFLELRDGADSTVVVATRSALLQRDGDIIDVDGVSPVAFSGFSAGDYYLAVRHRNHLGAMSAMPIAFSGTPTVVDFTGSPAASFGGANGIASLVGGAWGLYCGDFNQNGQVQNTDYGSLVPTLGSSGYVPGDMNLNGQVQNTDLQLQLLPNIGKGQAIP